MKASDLGNLEAEVRRCILHKYHFDPDTGAIEVTLTGGDGFQTIAGFSKVEFDNLSLTFDISTGNADYDEATKSRVLDWAFHETELVISCREKGTLLWDLLTGMTILAPPMNMKTDWEGFFDGSPQMN